jgi:hypothetical protein
MNMKMYKKCLSLLIKSTRSLKILALAMLLPLSTQAADQKMVLQVDASLSINQLVEFATAPFVLLEGDPSTLAEEGLGGYKVELTANSNQDKSYTLFSKIYSYTKSGYTLLGTPSIKLEYQSAGTIQFVSDIAGPVTLQLEIVKQALMTSDTSDFGESVR